MRSRCVPGGRDVDAPPRAITNQPIPEVDPDATPFSPSRITLTAGLILTISVVAFETLAVATILPAVVADLGGLDLYGWAFSAFLLTQLVGIVIAGLLADERGPALPFLLGVVLF